MNLAPRSVAFGREASCPAPRGAMLGAPGAGVPMKAIRFKVNGKAVTVTGDPDRRLLWALRTDLDLTGTKYGCGAGACGACTVVVDGEAVQSCQTPLGAVEGKDVLTIEGLERDGRLHPLQEAFAEHGALQCGYCTPGMIMRAYAFLRRERRPSREAIAAALEGHLCRCGSHARILSAVEAASRKGAAS